ncbi:MAG: class I SAM-dependent methyltransferase [Caldilineaceae bacterium]|nr:class I SAM-dependent methyltransferase [Caldilineaceae bacterium]
MSLPTQPDAYSFTRYLSAKRSVDDRALNRHVYAALQSHVTAQLAALDRPLAVLEIGAGIGTMVDRLLAWNLFGDQRDGVHYTALDAEADNISTAQARLASRPEWLSLRLVTEDALAFAQRPEQQQYDLLIAHAVLDLLDMDRALPLLRRLLRPDGSFYFTINFDGATILQPAIDPSFDTLIAAAYHDTMDTRIVDGLPSGDSCTGRHLFSTLPAHGFRIAAAGSSDWVVHAIDGEYPEDERYFLHFIVQTMAGALRDHPHIDARAFADWIKQRHEQVSRGELIYIAHQLDFFGIAGS